MMDGTQNAQNGSSSFLSSANQISLNLDKNVKDDYLLNNNVLTRNLDLNMVGKTDNACVIESGEISVQCVVPPMPLVEEEGRRVGRVQASVY